MATFNGERFIDEQLDSILPQLSDKDEIVISDDSSTDSTVKRIKKRNDPRIVIFENQKFRNPIQNFENAIKNSSGDLIFLADQDDVWEGSKIQKMKENLEDHDLVLCDCALTDSELNVLIPSYFKKYKSSKGFFRNLKKNSYIGSCLAFNRKIKHLALPFPKNIPMHDYWIGMTAEIFGNVCFLNEPLVLHRIHEKNVSQTGSKSRHHIFSKITFRFNLLFSLFMLLLFKKS